MSDGDYDNYNFYDDDLNYDEVNNISKLISIFYQQDTWGFDKKIDTDNIGFTLKKQNLRKLDLKSHKILEIKF